MVVAEKVFTPPVDQYSHRLTDYELELIATCFAQIPEHTWFFKLILPTRELSAAEIFWQYRDSIIQFLRSKNQTEDILYDYDFPLFSISRNRIVE